MKSFLVILQAQANSCSSKRDHHGYFLKRIVNFSRTVFFLQDTFKGCFYNSWVVFPSKLKYVLINA